MQSDDGDHTVEALPHIAPEPGQKTWLAIFTISVRWQRIWSHRRWNAGTTGDLNDVGRIDGLVETQVPTAIFTPDRLTA